MDSLEKAELTALISHIERFKIKNTDLQYGSPVTRLAEKQEEEGEEEEYRKLQSVMCFSQTQ